MDYIQKVTISEEKVRLWEETLGIKDDGKTQIDWNKRMDTISVSFQQGVEAQLKLYPAYNKNVLLVNGQEVDSFELSDEFTCFEYHLHYNNDNYIVILEKE